MRLATCFIILTALYCTPLIHASEQIPVGAPQDLIEKKEKAEEQKQAEEKKEEKKDEKKEEKKEKPRNDYIIIPAIYYTPETSVAFGLSVLFYYRPSNQLLENRPAVIQPTVIYTIRNQIILILGGENYLDTDQKWYLFYRVEGSKYPDKFWGIGDNTPEWAEEDFTAWYGLIDITARYKVWGDLGIGLLYDFAGYDMRDLDTYTNKKDPDGRKVPAQLKGGKKIPGSNGGYYNAIGPLLQYDSRDRVSATSKGIYATLSLLPYHRYTGSSANFYKGEFDFRWYYSFIEDYVFALQWDTVLSEGDVPFTMMPKLGGRDKLRGLPEGRYRDRNMSLLQLEMRIPIVWRFGAVFFASAGSVWNRFENIHPERITYGGGMGIRLTVDKDEKVNARADIGVTKEGWAIYFYLMEAF
ncbi:MAG TPA: BamA/TamA family outer membrane protein [bacterium]|nr:BamA/TamA family outer membrane protein [bacterium]